MSEPQHPNPASPFPRPRGLWALMGTGATPPANAPANDAIDRLVENPVTAEGPAVADVDGRQEVGELLDAKSLAPSPIEPEAADTPAPPRRSLWAVMGREVASALDPHSSTESTTPATAALSSHSGLTSAAHEVTSDFRVTTPRITSAIDPESDSAIDGVRSELSPSEIAAAAAADLTNTSSSGAVPAETAFTISRHVRRHEPQGWSALVCGLVALPLSACAWQPGVVASLPGAMSGFLALGLAVSVGTHARASRSARRRATVGGACALLALAAGPLLFAPAGNRHRWEQARLPTQRHLSAIGAALSDYHDEHRTYPIGGTTIIQPDGRRRGGHGWMTHLLPYLGQAAVYQQIQLAAPYDADVNRPAMGTLIDAYLAAGGNSQLLPGGYAPTHFAGVGGTVINPAGEEVAAGIFELQRAVRQRDLTAGLAQSWIAGEIPAGYPAWGDTENWRTSRKGLNRDPRGFGNASGTGATLLFADGSARFFGNQTDPELLRQLSVRGSRD